ncbi:hypothetical protein CPC08DRAFT_730903 [Agrocybe pediades]|nr:hypothetical protein CPC08DRAFT_730903 [Agrocybe pediades]
MPNMMRYAIRPFLNAVMVGTYTDNPIKFPGSIHGELTALVQFLQLPIMELEDFAPADFPPQTSWTLLIISRCLHDYVLPLQLDATILLPHKELEARLQSTSPMDQTGLFNDHLIPNNAGDHRPKSTSDAARLVVEIFE